MSAVMASSAPLQKEKKKQGALGFAASGVVAGIVTKSVCAPVDRIRLLYQVQGMFSASPEAVAAAGSMQAAKQKVKYQGLIHTAKTIMEEEGVVGFWRGNGTNIIRASVVYAMKFGVNDALKEKMTRRAASSGKGNNDVTKSSALLRHGVSEGHQQLGILSLMTAGGIAGLIQKCVSYPLDLLSVRIGLGVNTSTLSKDQKKYTSIKEAVKRIHHSEGYAGFYKGFGPTIVTGVPYVMFQMTFFELYRRKVQKTFFNDSSSSNNSQKKKSMVEAFATNGLSGSLAAVTAQGIVFPGDTVRKRMMANGVDGRKRLYKNSFDCAKKLYQREGWVSFYNGVGPMCIRAIPAGAIQFGCYELCKSIVLYFQNDE